jgi:hypothetical protein
MRRILSLLPYFCFVSISLFAGNAWPGEPQALTVQPEILEIGTFYAGGSVSISGEIPADQDVVVEIAGPVVNGQFDVKGRIGPFWMTRDKVELSGAPGMYILLLPEGQDWHRKAVSLGLGLENLKKTLSIQSATLSPDDVFNMFLELKKSKGFYVEQKDAVSYSPGQMGRRRFTVVYHFSRATAAGTYTIKASTIEKGRIRTETSRPFLVREVGFPKYVDDMATHHRLMYGILAVMIALFTGAVMGLLFKGGGGGH